MSEMTHAWHAQKSAHNYRVYLYLNLQSPDYVDWEVILLLFCLQDDRRVLYQERPRQTPESHAAKQDGEDHLANDRKKIRQTVRSEQDSKV